MHLAIDVLFSQERQDAELPRSKAYPNCMANSTISNSPEGGAYSL